MKEYSHLPNFLKRWTVLHIGRLHIRIHHITASDGTPFLHTHPFHYISCIVSGGYSEQLLTKSGEIQVKHHGRGSVLFRGAKTFHRILSCRSAKTFIITFGLKKPEWQLMRHDSVATPLEYKIPESKGVYTRSINGKTYFALFDSFWRVGKESYDDACKETKPSIHQCGPWGVLE